LPWSACSVPGRRPFTTTADDATYGAFSQAPFLPLPAPRAAGFKRKELRCHPNPSFFVICLLIANGAMGQAGQLEIKAPWARATPGRAENGAAYLMIVSPTTDRLTAASPPVAKKVEHNRRNK
jgi:hypothetical protein